MKGALAVILAGVLLAPVASGLAQMDPAIKLLELEARIDQLTRRVDALEAGAQAGMEGAPGVRMGKDLAWHFDGYLVETPFKVSQQELDRKTGRVDLLLNLVAEPTDGDQWRAAQVGDSLPVEVTATLAGGSTVGPFLFVLERRTDFIVGTHVHIRTQLQVEDLKAVRRLAIRHRGAR